MIRNDQTLRVCTLSTFDRERRSESTYPLRANPYSYSNEVKVGKGKYGTKELGVSAQGVKGHKISVRKGQKMVSNQEKINQLDDEHIEMVEEPTKEEGWKGSYAWSFISYAEPHEFLPLLAQAKHWCYIKHDKDKNEDGTPKVTHYHILARFPTERSLNSCRKLQLGTQNLLGKQMRKLQDQMKLTAYLTHDTEACRKAKKHVYNIEDVVFKPNDNYWEKQFDKEADQANQKASNEDFLNDLLAEDFSLREMAIKYGRDFIKNFDKYMRFRGLFTINSWEPTEADIERKEREYNRAFNECQTDLEEIYETPSGVEIDLELRKIRLEKTKNGNQN